MKKLLVLLALLVFSTSTVIAQKMNRQRVRLLKTSFMTDALDLTPKEAEKFWPIYNLYNIEILKSRNELERGLMSKFANSEGNKKFTEAQAKQFIDQVNTLEQNIVENKIKMFKELAPVISAKKIVKLMKAERDFNRRILQEYGKRSRMNRQ